MKFKKIYLLGLTALVAALLGLASACNSGTSASGEKAGEQTEAGGGRGQQAGSKNTP